MSQSVTKPTAFTLDQLDWLPWIETIAEAGLSEAELEAIYAEAPNARNSTYFGTLAHDLPALIQRTGLFTQSMRSPGGAPNSDRELAAVAVSRVNGCIYCASVHARLYVQYAKNLAQMQRILDEGTGTNFDSAREQAIVAFSVRLTEDATGITAADLAPMRAAGMNDLEIYDVAQAAAMFAWANRLMQTLGEPIVPQGASGV
ncbi:MAG TPA: peroxidase-related enzyme [Thermomicrobiales bacterium]|nr:peroxidase-related enzyme [Thermomicrobiales bacterium]